MSTLTDEMRREALEMRRLQPVFPKPERGLEPLTYRLQGDCSTS